MNLRKITSLTAFLSFVLLTINSIVLYVEPTGRVAYWADWHLAGLSKKDWDNIHVNLGVLFLLSIFLHIYYNWKPITTYLKNKSREMRIFTVNFNVALLLSVLFVAGTLAGLPPFSTILDISRNIKGAAEVKYGEPPYGHAELSTLESFTWKMRLDLNKAMALLQTAGIEVEDEKQSVKDIARKNDLSPQQVYLVMKPAEKQGKAYASASGSALPEEPQPGLGKQPLADICKKYDFNVATVIKRFASQGIKAESQMTMKEIGDKNKVSPHDLYEALKGLRK